MPSLYEQARQLFGFEMKPAKEVPLKSFVQKDFDDGALSVSSTAGGMGYNTAIDLDGTVRTEAELVTRYREMSLQPEIDSAVDEIVNEMVDIGERKFVKVDLDDIETLSASVRKAVAGEFDHVIKLLDFNRRAYEILRRWYIDGRLYYHCLVDDKNLSEGIQEVRYVDPRKMRKVREIVRMKIPGQNDSEVSIPVVKNEYYIYNDRGFAGIRNLSAPTGSSATGIRVNKDAVAYVVSGLTDTNGTMVLSYLHKAIKAMNQLRALEDALVIYRLARAPERRIWYIDVGNLPKMKAEQYVRDIMVKHKNRLVYDAGTGEVKDSRKFMTMLDDFWLPRREGGRGTEVDVLAGGQNLSQMDDVLYFQKRLYQTLNVPVNRLNSDALFSLGRATEVSRDEVKFAKFVTRLRGRFSELFVKILGKQVVLKNIMTQEEWADIEEQVRFNFSSDSYFTELKDNEVLSGRFELFQMAEDSQIAGRYISHDTLRRQILRQSDTDIETEDAKIEKEIEATRASMGDMGLDVGDGQGGGEKIEPGKKKPKFKPTKADKAANDGSDGKIARMRQAQIKYEQLKKKGANRSSQEQSEFKKVTQVVAKNGGSIK